MQLNILYQDKQILVCEKPAGTPTQSKNLYTKDMVSIIKSELAKQSDSNTEPYLGLVHRLDQPVGGIMVFAKIPAAAKELSAQIQKNQIKKHYLAVISNDLSSVKGQTFSLTDEMVQNKKDNTSAIVPNKTKESKTAKLNYAVIDALPYKDEIISLIDVELITGRHHQIRVQTASHLGGIWGDKKYNKKFQNVKTTTSLCLYSYQLEFLHPVSKKPLKFHQIPSYDLFSQFSIG